MDKLSTNRIVKIGIVTADVEDTKRRLLELFNTLPPYDSDKPHGDLPVYTDEDRYKRYKGEPADEIELKTDCVYLDPVYFELVQPVGDAKNPWNDHFKKFGTSVCFISFYIDGFEKHIDFMNRLGYPLLFEEEKGYERYAYFDTLKDLGFTLEMKERTPNPKKQ